MSLLAKTSKEWLVRTRSREVLGPFTSRELLTEIELQTVLPGDEISKSADFWIFVQDINLESGLDQYYRDPEVTPAASILDYHIAQEAKKISPISRRVPELIRMSVVRPQEEESSVTVFGIFISAALLLVYFLSFNLQLKFGSSDNTERTLASLDLYTRKGDKEAAYDLLQRHKELVTANPQKWLPYSIILTEKKQSFDKAKEYLAKGIEESPNSYFWLGYLELKSGELEKAAEYFQKSVELKPQDNAGRFNLGVTQYKLNNYESALKLFQQVSQLDVQLIPSKIYLAKTYEKLDRLPEAREAFENAIFLSPERWSSRAAYAEYLYRNHQETQARNVLNEMLTLDPEHEKSSADFYEYWTEKVSMSDYSNIFERIMGGSWSVEKQIGKMYLDFLISPNAPRMEMKERALNGNLTAQVLWLKMLLDTQDSHPDTVEEASLRLPEKLEGFGYYAYVLRADAKARLGRTSEAKSDLEVALELSPKSAISRLGYVSLLGILKQQPLAQKELHKLLSDHPQYVPALKLSTLHNAQSPH